MANQERFHPDFATDLAAATDYYDRISTGTGDRFRKAVDERLDYLRDSPEYFAAIYESVRAARIKRFPYVIVYEYQPNVVHFLALVHGASEQKNWFTRT